MQDALNPIPHRCEIREFENAPHGPGRAIDPLTDFLQVVYTTTDEHNLSHEHNFSLNTFGLATCGTVKRPVLRTKSAVTRQSSTANLSAEDLYPLTKDELEGCLEEALEGMEVSLADVRRCEFKLSKSNLNDPGSTHTFVDAMKLILDDLKKWDHNGLSDEVDMMPSLVVERKDTERKESSQDEMKAPLVPRLSMISFKSGFDQSALFK